MLVGQKDCGSLRGVRALTLRVWLRPLNSHSAMIEYLSHSFQKVVTASSEGDKRALARIFLVPRCDELSEQQIE